MALDLLTTTAVDLQRLLEAGKTTNVQLIVDYLSQIEKHDPRLHAFISLAPRQLLLDVAAARDEERRKGHVRGPLHGIPIVLKDCFSTAPELGMGTTAGSWALVDARAKANSALAQRLLDQGLIILGKTNMTVRSRLFSAYKVNLNRSSSSLQEFAGLKSSAMTPGWSAVGGQTLSPYVGAIAEGETILGHSVSIEPIPCAILAAEPNLQEPRWLIHRLCRGRGRWLQPSRHRCGDDRVHHHPCQPSSTLRHQANSRRPGHWGFIRPYRLV